MHADDRFHSLDGLRGVAAIAVLVYHCSTAFLPGGYLAVDFFFCLSGFVIAHGYAGRLAGGSAGEQMSARLFMELRAARLWPMIAVGALLGMVLHGGNAGMLLLIPVPGGTALYPTNPPFWSLLDEVLVNLLFALALVRLATARLLAALLAAAVLLAAFLLATRGYPGLGPEWSSFHVGLARALFGFTAGLVLHRLWLARGRPRQRSRFAVALPALLLAVMALDPVDSEPYRLFAMLLVMPALVWAGIVVEMPGKPLWQKLGDLSYPLYCIHMPIVYFISDDPQVRLLAAGGTLALALLLDRYYDRPLRGWLGKQVRRNAASRQQARLGPAAA